MTPACCGDKWTKSKLQTGKHANGKVLVHKINRKRDVFRTSREKQDVASKKTGLIRVQPPCTDHLVKLGDGGAERLQPGWAESARSVERERV